jgi:dTDP-glucose 4,6-dehydratase
VSESKRLLITGGAGFIGANFTQFWLRRHPTDHVVVLDALTYAGNMASLAPVVDDPNFTFVHGDICDQELVERLLADHRIDTVAHFAAESHVDRSILGPDTFIRTNILGTQSLLEAARARWPRTAAGEVSADYRFHHVSSDEVYGSLGADAPPSTESDPYAPNSPYSASKASSDHLVRAYQQTYGIPTTISNGSNNFGPYQFPEKLIPLMLIQALAGKPLPVYGDGRHRRDWVFVEDHCRGIALVVEGRTGETYNIGGENEWANLEVVELLCRLLDEEFARDPELGDRFSDAPAVSGRRTAELITFVEDRPGHDRRYALDISKARSELGYEPEQSFEISLRYTVRWYLENQTWWGPVLDGSYREWMDEQYGLEDSEALSGETERPR